MSKTQFDIAVVGGGMVGSALACALAIEPATAALKIALVEADESIRGFSGNNFDPRVVALSLKSKNFLQTLGIWESIQKQRVCSYTNMYVWDGDGTAHIEFDCHEIRQQQLGFIVENSVVLRALRQRLASCKNITAFTPAQVVSVDNENYSAKRSQQLVIESGDNQTSISAKLVVAADGARSKLRDMTGFTTREWDYGHSAIVTTVKTQNSHQFTAWQRFTTQGPIAFLPLVDETLSPAERTHYSSLVWSAEQQLASTLMEESDENFAHKLGRAFEQKLGAVVGVDRRISFPLKQRYAKHYIKPGIALVGDAAHTIHPLAGQGVNLGLYDVIAFTKEVARSQIRGFPLEDDSVLQRYERERQSHNMLAMATMEGFKRLFAAENPTIRWMRNAGMGFFNEQVWLKKKLIAVANG